MMPNINQQSPQDFEKQLGQIKEIFSKNSSGIIALPMRASQDAVAAGTALYLGLIKAGKSVSIVASEKIQSDLVASDKIQSNLSTGGDNLVVSFPYTEGSIDKVDYNIQGSRFNMIVIPREGFPKISTDNVQFTYVGGKIDFIITIDAPTLNSLGSIYSSNENIFSGKNIVNIDRHIVNSLYGIANLVNKSASSTSEIVWKLIQDLKLQADKDIATNLLAGITSATNNFTSYSVNADTFEAVSTLMRAGAVKRAVMPGMTSINRPYAGGGFSGPNSYPPQMSQYPSPMMNQQMPMGMPFDQFPQTSNGQPRSTPAPSIIQNVKPIQDVEKESGYSEVTNEMSGTSKQPETSLKPKIFSGSGGLV